MDRDARVREVQDRLRTEQAEVALERTRALKYTAERTRADTKRVAAIRRLAEQRCGG